MYEDICYKKPFLKEVIFRLDFPSPLPGLEKALPTKISNKILKNFPISEPQKTHAQEFQFAGPDFQARSTEVMEWVFHGNEREKSLKIVPNAIVLSVRDYKTYELLLSNIKQVIEEFFKTFKDLSASRIGLRYVNIIDIEKEDDPLSWNEYINEGMLGIIDFHEEKKTITRAFHILEYNFDGQAVKFQFGIANPDYPATVKRKQFVLDIDSYFNGAFECNDVIEGIEASHEKIQSIFEDSITNKTRKLMKRLENG